MRSLTTLALLPLFLLTACGGGEDDEGAGGSTDGGDTAAGESCTTDVVATYADGSEVPLDETVALNVGQGAAYTIYAADFDLGDTSAITGAVPDENGHLATLAITTFNAEGTPEQVEEGAMIDWTDEFGVLTFSVVLNQGTTALGSTMGAAGTVEVLSLADDALCVEVDYSDDEKGLAGVIHAAVL